MVNGRKYIQVNVLIRLLLYTSVLFSCKFELVISLTAEVQIITLAANETWKRYIYFFLMLFYLVLIRHKSNQQPKRKWVNHHFMYCNVWLMMKLKPIDSNYFRCVAQLHGSLWIILDGFIWTLSRPSVPQHHQKSCCSHARDSFQLESNRKTTELVEKLETNKDSEFGLSTGTRQF